MTTPQPRARRCEGCGHRFRVSGDEVYCSAICAGQVGMASVYAGLRGFARVTPRIRAPVSRYLACGAAKSSGCQWRGQNRSSRIMSGGGTAITGQRA